MLYSVYAALLASSTLAVSIPPTHMNAGLNLDLSSIIKASNTSGLGNAENSKHLQLDFTVLRGEDAPSAAFGTQKNYVNDNYPIIPLIDRSTYYATILRVGSNGDENVVAIDTGSSDLWVMSSNVACNYQTNSKRSTNAWPHSHGENFENDTQSFKNGDARIDNTCTSMGSFNPQGSSTFQLNSSAPSFQISYVDGNEATGVWGTDTVSVGSVTVPHCSLAVVTTSSSLFGILGIGLTLQESTDTSTTPYQYQNFPQLLKKNGMIEKVSYSLYLNSSNAQYGSILFGAVDHAKYTGQLQTVPLVNTYPSKFAKPFSFDIVLNSISLENSQQNIQVSSTPFAAVLDSGTTLTQLPGPIMNSLASSLKAKISSTSNLYEVSCDYLTSSAYIVYNFSGAEIGVPVSELIIPIGNKKCVLGVMQTMSSDVKDYPEAILGDNFLRHAYVVYNLEDMEISLAQVQYSSNTNIDVISSSVPQAVRAPGYSSTSLPSSIPTQPKVTHLKASGSARSNGFSSLCVMKSLFLAFSGLFLVLAL